MCRLLIPSEKVLENGISYIRNIYISKVLYEAGYIEKLGTGFSILFQSYRERKFKPPQVIEGEGFVKCILPMSKIAATDSADPLSAILGMFDWRDQIGSADVLENLNVSHATASRYLLQLVKSKKLKRIGRGPAIRYIRV